MLARITLCSSRKLFTPHTRQSESSSRELKLRLNCKSCLMFALVFFPESESIGLRLRTSARPIFAFYIGYTSGCLERGIKTAFKWSCYSSIYFPTRSFAMSKVFLNFLISHRPITLNESRNFQNISNKNRGTFVHSSPPTETLFSLTRFPFPPFPSRSTDTYPPLIEVHHSKSNRNGQG